MKKLVLLQNAWAKNERQAKQFSKYAIWVRALARSRSGQRLSYLLDLPRDDWRPWLDRTQIVFGNCTSRVGSKSSDSLAPEPEWVRELVATERPEEGDK